PVGKAEVENQHVRRIAPDGLEHLGCGADRVDDVVLAAQELGQGLPDQLFVVSDPDPELHAFSSTFSRVSALASRGSALASRDSDAFASRGSDAFASVRVSVLASARSV